MSSLGKKGKRKKERKRERLAPIPKTHRLYEINQETTIWQKCKLDFIHYCGFLWHNNVQLNCHCKMQNKGQHILDKERGPYIASSLSLSRVRAKN